MLLLVSNLNYNKLNILDAFFFCFLLFLLHFLVLFFLIITTFIRY